MIKVKDISYLKDMGFTQTEEKDFVYREIIDGSPKTLFTIYAGSLYIRHAKASYSSAQQFKCIYEWTKKNYIEWEE